MTKLTKISATALFALFLTACDKPANKPAEEAKLEATPAAEQAKPETAPAAEQAAPATEQAQSQAPAKLSEAELAEGKADLQRILDWNKAQEQIANQAQQALQEKLATQDPKEIEDALNNFTRTINDTIKSLDSVEVKNELVKTFKEKTKEILTLSSAVITDSVEVMSAPTLEAQEALKAKTQQLLQQGAELQKLESELRNTFDYK